MSLTAAAASAMLFMDVSAEGHGSEYGDYQDPGGSHPSSNYNVHAAMGEMLPASLLTYLWHIKILFVMFSNGFVKQPDFLQQNQKNDSSKNTIFVRASAECRLNYIRKIIKVGSLYLNEKDCYKNFCFDSSILFYMSQ
jgi:hypothetical protein